MAVANNFLFDRLTMRTREKKAGLVKRFNERRGGLYLSRVTPVNANPEI
jgi:hypothetical protein